jgi:target of rapamycin complex subunit LST8
MRSVSIAPNGTVAVAANNDGSVFVWRLAPEDTSRFELLEKFTAHKNYILKAAISPDSK